MTVTITGSVHNSQTTVFPPSLIVDLTLNLNQPSCDNVSEAASVVVEPSSLNSEPIFT